MGFHNSATGLDLGFYAARSYSLMRPPRTEQRLIRSYPQIGADAARAILDQNASALLGVG